LDIGKRLADINNEYCTYNFDPINLIALYANTNYIVINNTVPPYCSTLVTNIDFQASEKYILKYENEFYKIWTKSD